MFISIESEDEPKANKEKLNDLQNQETTKKKHHSVRKLKAER